MVCQCSFVCFVCWSECSLLMCLSHNFFFHLSLTQMGKYCIYSNINHPCIKGEPPPPPPPNRLRWLCRTCFILYSCKAAHFWDSEWGNIAWLVLAQHVVSVNNEFVCLHFVTPPLCDKIREACCRMWCIFTIYLSLAGKVGLHLTSTVWHWSHQS
jgi:hypothetical protein